MKQINIILTIVTLMLLSGCSGGVGVFDTNVTNNITVITGDYYNVTQINNITNNITSGVTNSSVNNFTNKIIDADLNTVTNIGSSELSYHAIYSQPELSIVNYSLDYVLVYDNSTQDLYKVSIENLFRDNVCPLGYTCISSYSDLVAAGVNSSITHAWITQDLTENGNDLVIDHDMIIKGNNFKIIYDTVGCSGGNVLPNTDKNIEIHDFWFEGNGCSTPMFYNITSGAAKITMKNIKVTDVPVKVGTMYFREADLQNINLSNVQAGLGFDNSLYDGHYIIDTVYGTWDNSTSSTESELIEINHLGGYAKITNVFSGVKDKNNSFGENVIDCNILKCDVDNVIIYDYKTSSNNALVYLDTTHNGDKVYNVNNVKVFGACNNMVGIRLGGSTTTGYDTGTVTNSVVYGCSDNSSSNNAGIRVAGNMKDVTLINNKVNGTYYGVLSSVSHLYLEGNMFNTTFKQWHDSAPSATRATNLRIDRQTMQQGSSGYLCIDNPVREWEVRYGASC